jgi:hypothetical protein
MRKTSSSEIAAATDWSFQTTQQVQVRRGRSILLSVLTNAMVNTPIFLLHRTIKSMNLFCKKRA